MKKHGKFKKLSKSDIGGILVSVAVAVALIYGIYKVDSGGGNAEYRQRSAAESAYLRDLRAKYSGKSRSLDAEYARSIIREACGFIDSAKNLENAYATEDAVDLLLGTALVESDLYPRFQDGGGDAIGLFQIEYGTYRDLWNRAIKNKHPRLYEAIRREYGSGPTRDISFEDLQKNDTLSAIFSRIKYAESGAPIPPKSDVAAQAEYYKKIYNTPQGASTPEKYILKRRGLEAPAPNGDAPQ